jgi:ParB family chromosome partitioning protein
VSAIKPNPFQPRRDFDEVALAELASSIEASGLLQPVVVRSSHGGYELIAGERRWRAVQRLGWQKLPAVVKEVSDQELLTLALIENLQRDELSPIDTARGYERLHEQFKLSHADVARLVGKNRSTVANSLRLLQLPAEVQSRVQDRTISEGHARALLAVTDPAELSRLAAQVAEQGWSVRETEALVRGEGPVAVASGRTTGTCRRYGSPCRTAPDRGHPQTPGNRCPITAKRKGRGRSPLAITRTTTWRGVGAHSRQATRESRGESDSPENRGTVALVARRCRVTFSCCLHQIWPNSP